MRKRERVIEIVMRERDRRCELSGECGARTCTTCEETERVDETRITMGLRSQKITAPALPTRLAYLPLRW